jgi:glycosyltransferase involved in cell wall biosynthesis
MNSIKDSYEMTTKLPQVYFFCFLYPPIARTRSRQIITQSLSEAGFPVKVISIKNPHGFFNKFIKDTSVPPDSLNVKVEYSKTPNWWMLGELLSILKVIPDPQMNWAWAVKRRMRKIIDTKQGVIIGLYPPLVNFIAADYAKKITGFPLILDYRDEFLDLIAPYSGSRRSKLLNFEQKIVNAADLIAVATPEIKNKLQSRYGIEDKKIIVCYSGFSQVHKSADQFFDNQTKNAFKKETLKMVYAGAISQHQKPEIIALAYKKLLQKYPDLKEKITITFYGPDNYYFKHVFKKYLGNGLIYGGFLPQSKIDDVIASYDVGFFSLAGDNYKYAIPRKLFDYINMELPILAAIPRGEAWKIIEDNKIGKAVHYSNIDEIVNAIYDFYKMDNLNYYKQNIRLIKDQFSAQHQYKKLAERIYEIINK